HPFVAISEQNRRRTTGSAAVFYASRLGRPCRHSKTYLHIFLRLWTPLCGRAADNASVQPPLRKNIQNRLPHDRGFCRIYILYNSINI
ncbi:MAG: hypothetical protein IJF59_05055, partial [Clostridia bacterium]|nr:hypothetical protein [Clostridia bacterium]